MASTLLHRQRLLLKFLETLDRACGRLFLMKSMFLLCNEELHADVYDFHPYKHGPFSLTLFSDLRVLERTGYLRQSEHDVHVLRTLEPRMAQSISKASMSGLQNVARRYKDATDLALLRKVYREYPYFATRNLRCGSRYAFADPRRDPTKQKAAIFTIGYEGKNIDRFLNELIMNNIHVLVDIRHNPVSMKYDFSGAKLWTYCSVRSVGYLGIPELGIPSAQRQNLLTSADYSRLFVQYRRDVLPNAQEHFQLLRGLLDQGKRIALLCFEKDHELCHRNDASSALSAFCNQRYGLCHI